LALPFPAAHGGLGGRPIEVTWVMQALGKALRLEPQLSTLMIGSAALRSASAALAAEAVGVMDTALAMTVEHLKTRQQFGGPIARLQALQHRAAEMLSALEQSRSMAMHAALMQGEPDAGEHRKVLSAVKVQIGQAARFVGQQAIQLHGGIGVTEEYAVGLHKG
jgi:alkylation response protein AidB-like acyl-CoA dehydrogenase